MASVASVIPRARYKERAQRGGYLEKYEPWTVSVPFTRKEIEEIKLEWRTMGDIYGHVLGSVKAAPVRVPALIKSNTFENKERLVVMLHRIRVVTRDGEVINVQNKVVQDGKSFYFLKNGREGEVVCDLVVFLRNKEKVEKIPVMYIGIESYGRALVANKYNLQVKKLHNNFGAAYTPPRYSICLAGELISLKSRKDFERAYRLLRLYICKDFKVFREADVEEQSLPEGLFLKITGWIIHKDKIIEMRFGRTWLKRSEKGIRAAKAKLVNLFNSNAGREISFGHQRFYVKNLSREEQKELDNVKFKKREECELVWYSGRPLNHKIIPKCKKYYLKVEDDPEKKYRKWILWNTRGLKAVIENRHHRDVGLDRIFVKSSKKYKLVIVHLDPDSKTTY